MIESKIESLLEEKFKEEDFGDCFLLEVKLHANRKLDVFIDCDSGVTFEKCQAISRYLEKYLDEEGWLGDKYVLEVSSPGVTRPLQLPRQYRKNIGRKVEVSTNDGKSRTGTLVSVEENGITIEEKVRIKEGKRKKTQILHSAIPFENIVKAIVKVSF